MKGRDPELLDDKAEKEYVRPASPFNATWRTARWCRRPRGASCDFTKKNTHRRPYRQTELSDWTAAGFARGRWLIDWAQR